MQLKEIRASESLLVRKIVIAFNAGCVFFSGILSVCSHSQLLWGFSTGLWLISLILNLKSFKLMSKAPLPPSWAAEYIPKLQKGEAVQFRAGGPSMRGKIDPGQLCIVEPTDPDRLIIGDVVLCQVNGHVFLHLIKAVKCPFLLRKQFLIGNNLGDVDGWISERSIYGKCTRIE